MTMTEQHTEASMLARLRHKYGDKAGNGSAYSVVTHVRDRAGFDAGGTMDALVMSLWPSRGLSLEGFEVKVSRGDWLRELKKPEKMERFARLVDFWWVVAPSDAIQDHELPAAWGWLVPHGAEGLRVRKPAEALRDLTPPRPPVDRSFLACILRSALRHDPEAVVKARSEAAERTESLYKSRLADMEGRYEGLRQRVQEFEQAAGASLQGWSGGKSPEEVGRALRTILDGDRRVEQIEQSLDRLRRQAVAITEQIDAVRDGWRRTET